MVRQEDKGAIFAHTLISASPHQVSAELGDETIILSLESGTYYSLDAIGARVWELIQAPRQVGEIRDAILAEYEVEPERCEGDLLALLQRLEDAALISAE